MNALHMVLREGPRYALASAVALVFDAGLYIALIRLAKIHYLAAAPAGYVLGILIIYLLSTRWVFSDRRLASAPSEFLIFALIGIVGLLLNQLIIYVCVASFFSSYEVAKLASAITVFAVNFCARKFILFTRY